VVPDASRITPPVLKPGQRSGHDIALSVALDAGLAIKNIESISHVVNIDDISEHEKKVQLNPADTIPNKDFVLRYEVAGNAPEIASLAHHDERGGFFTLMIQPQRTVAEAAVLPRELIFIVDTSGSMRGFPMDKSKQAIRQLINGMRPTDTFNVVRFAGDTGTLWNQPKLKTAANVSEALRYVDQFRGYGGTQMREGIVDALAQPAAEGYLRIAFLLTDGYVGNEFGIFQAIEKERRGARVFCLGVGSSVNRYLLERAAEIGRGEAFYVRQDENSDKVIDKFFQRVDKPALAHIEIDWGNLDVAELSPAKVPDLWAGQPIRIHGRYTQGGEDTIVVRGQLRNQPYEQRLHVKLPQNEPAHEAMATVWARQQVRQLMTEMVRQGETKELVEQVTQLGLTYRLMTQWTSFVAVEETVVNVDGKPQTVVQPVEIPEGVSYEGVFGEPSAPLHIMGGATRGGSSQSLFRSSKGRRFMASPSAAPPVPSTSGSGVVMAPPSLPSISPSRIPTVESADSEAKKSSPAKEILSDILFAAGQATLSEQAQSLLNKWAAKICHNLANIKRIEVIGHADSSPADNFKQKLSLERAVAVMDYLVKQCPGIAHKLMMPKGEADQQPIADNTTEEGRALNRRVEIKIKI
jgi:Ca-activated chloride channel family protein